MNKNELEALLSHFHTNDTKDIKVIACCYYIMRQKFPPVEYLQKALQRPKEFSFPKCSFKTDEEAGLSLQKIADFSKNVIKRFERIDYETWLKEQDDNSDFDMVHGHKTEINREEEIERLIKKKLYSQIWRDKTKTVHRNSLHTYWVRFSYHPEMVNTIKALGGISMYVNWNPDLKLWTITESGITNHETFVKTIKDFVQQNNFAVHSDLALEWYGDPEMIDASMMADSDFDVPSLKLPLRGYQRAGVKYAVSKKKVLIADEMRLGKTVQAIGTLVHEDSFPAIIVCPKNVMSVWKREFDKFTTIRANFWNEHERHANVIIVNYENVGKMLKAKDYFKSIVVDESHYIKSEKTKRFKDVHELSIGKDIRILLTGTPVVNNPHELAPQLQILGYLRSDTKAKFVQRYCGKKNEGKNLEELNMKLRSLCLIRRMVSQVYPELPPKTRQVIECNLTNMDEYNKAKADFINYLGDQGYSEGFQRRAMIAQALTQTNFLKRIAAEGKIDDIISFVENTIENKQKLVLFAYHRKVIQRIADHFKTDMVIHGDTPTLVRQQINDRFREDPSQYLVIIGMKAGSEGTDFSTADMVAFAEQFWTAASHDQAEDRIKNVMKNNPITAYYFLGKDTIDNRIFEVINAKRALLDETTGTTTLVNLNQSVFKEIMKREFNVEINDGKQSESGSEKIEAGEFEFIDNGEE